MNETMKVAVASKEGLAINEHFGHAKQFWIYELDGSECRLLEKREVEHYCLGNHSSKTAMAKILTTIADCRAVFVAKIGEGPTEKLQAIGVVAVADYAYEAIEDSLLDYAHKSTNGWESHVAEWAKAHPLSPLHVDCTIAVMLKILDGKCKMNAEEKKVMALLYKQVKQCPNELLDVGLHELIAAASQNLDEEMKLLIYEKRLLAETMISRPVMKGFKKMIREQGLLACQKETA